MFVIIFLLVSLYFPFISLMIIMCLYSESKPEFKKIYDKSDEQKANHKYLISVSYDPQKSKNFNFYMNVITVNVRNKKGRHLTRFISPRIRSKELTFVSKDRAIIRFILCRTDPLEDIGSFHLGHNSFGGGLLYCHWLQIHPISQTKAYFVKIDDSLKYYPPKHPNKQIYKCVKRVPKDIDKDLPFPQLSAQQMMCFINFTANLILLFCIQFRIESIIVLDIVLNVFFWTLVLTVLFLEVILLFHFIGLLFGRQWRVWFQIIFILLIIIISIFSAINAYIKYKEKIESFDQNITESTVETIITTSETTDKSIESSESALYYRIYVLSSVVISWIIFIVIIVSSHRGIHRFRRFKELEESEKSDPDNLKHYF